MRRFHLVRDVDVSGCSGTGIVAQGVQFPSGTCVMEWKPGKVDVCSLGTYRSAFELLAVHGHNGASRLEWIDPA